MVIGKSQGLRCLRNSELHAWMSELVGYLGVWVANMGEYNPQDLHIHDGEFIAKVSGWV